MAQVFLRGIGSWRDLCLREIQPLSGDVLEDGFLYAYLVNESNQAAYFDDFTFQLTGSRAPIALVCYECFHLLRVTLAWLCELADSEELGISGTSFSISKKSIKCEKDAFSQLPQVCNLRNRIEMLQVANLKQRRHQ